VLGARKKIFTFDTTLRDGTQGSQSRFRDDSLVIAQKLDELGSITSKALPGRSQNKEFSSAPRAEAAPRQVDGASARALRQKPVRQDATCCVLAANTPVISIFGKSWELHTQRPGHHRRRNLKPSRDVKVFEGPRQRSVSDAEHFFDGYQASAHSRCARSKPRRKPGRKCWFSLRYPTAHADRAGWPDRAEVRKRFDGVPHHTHKIRRGGGERHPAVRQAVRTCKAA